MSLIWYEKKWIGEVGMWYGGRWQAHGRKVFTLLKTPHANTLIDHLTGALPTHTHTPELARIIAENRVADWLSGT